MKSSVLELLEQAYLEFNHPDFIENDPISIPHSFSKREDIEIAGLIAALFAWGNRKTIINKSREFLALMNNQPHDFIMNHVSSDLKFMLGFKHRTFNADDALSLIDALRRVYTEHSTMENLFLGFSNMKTGICSFRDFCVNHKNFIPRTSKHLANPEKGSTAKRINMFLRWMVRKDKKGVDLGLWRKLSPSQLMMPLDVHVHRVALKLGLMERAQADWRAVEELTSSLGKLDASDPVRFDFALFGLGVSGKF